MKPAAAFAAGLWTGALVMATAGLVVYFWVLVPGAAPTPAPAPDALSQVQLLQQEQAKLTAEAQRLRQTVAELRAARLQSDAVHEARASRPREAAPPDSWVAESVLQGDAAAFAKLEQAASESNLAALDGLALLADRDNAETLTRVWSSAELTGAARSRATLLLAATVETNPHGEEIIEAAASDPTLAEAAAVGLATPDFASRLVRGSGIIPPPHFKPDYGLRLRLLDVLAAGATDATFTGTLARVHSQLMEHAAGGDQPAP